MNLKTFQKLLEIKFNNNEKFNLEFSFENSGTAKITKKNNAELNEPKRIYQVAPIKNFLKVFYKKFK